MTRFADVIRGWFGWCPNTALARISRGPNGTSGFQVPDLPEQGDGSAGSERPAGSLDLLYEHTQPGYLMMAAVGGTCVILLLTQVLAGPSVIALSVLGIMVFVLAIMSRLTVSITADTLRIRFGPVGLVRKVWRISDIVSAAPVTNPWYYGWGLRCTLHGPLYNVSGQHAVEILLLSGDRVRIGTDEPEALAKAINRAVR